MNSSNKEKTSKGKGAGHPIWKGHISFGLISIPVTLYSAEQRSDLQFHLIDSRDKSKIRYMRVNEVTGEEVPWDRVVKGYEFDESGNYVLLDDEDFKKADIKATETVALEDFVPAESLNCMYFEKPYYLVPDSKAVKGYVLLREILKKTGMIGIARVVIRTREYIAALLPMERALVINLLRYDQEMRKESDFDLPSEDIHEFGLSVKEIDMAEKFVESMTGAFRPEQYKDMYRERLMEWIQKKAKAGGKVRVAEEEAPAETAGAEVVDLMELLRKSIEQTQARNKKRRHQPSA
jgi:DNA end-binding protein Ku